MGSASLAGGIVWSHYMVFGEGGNYRFSSFSTSSLLHPSGGEDSQLNSSRRAVLAGRIAGEIWRPDQGGAQEPQTDV